MNDWTKIRETAIVEADDFMDQWDRNGLNFLFNWKAKFPKFKITLFTIPNRTTKEFRELISRHDEWIQFAVHGWNHESNFECYDWDYEKTKALMHRTYEMKGERESSFYQKIFKAPGWSITPSLNGYPADERSPLSKDPKVVYNALKDMNFVVVDRHYNKPARPEGSQVVCIDDNPDIVHFHTWNVPSPDLAGRNGFQDVEELHGVPWDSETNFKFISEAWNEGLFKPCQT